MLSRDKVKASVTQDKKTAGYWLKNEDVPDEFWAVNASTWIAAKSDDYYAPFERPNGGGGSRGAGGMWAWIPADVLDRYLHAGFNEWGEIAP